MPLKTIRDNDRERDLVNEVITLEEGGYQCVPAGFYEAKFEGLENIETVKGKAWRWCFSIIGGEHEGKWITELSGVVAAPGTKAGRFTCALAKQPLKVGSSANPSEHIGKRYQLVVEPKDETRTKITAFSLLN